MVRGSNSRRPCPLTRNSNAFPGHEQRMQAWIEHYEKLGLRGPPPPEPPPPKVYPDPPVIVVVMTLPMLLQDVIARLQLDPIAFCHETRSRKYSHVDQRYRAMWELRGMGLSLKDIGRLFGLDHTAVMHGIRKLAGVCKVGAVDGG